MKTSIITMAAALLLSMSAMAQENKQDGQQGRRQFNAEEFAQQRTDATAKKYGLNEEQTAKLLVLNKKYIGNMRRGFGGQGRGRGMGRNHGAKDSVDATTAATTAATPRHHAINPGDTTRFSRDTTRFSRGAHQGRGQSAGRGFMAEYDAELKTIMTEEQYNAYQADRKNAGQHRGGRNGGRRD